MLSAFVPYFLGLALLPAGCGDPPAGALPKKVFVTVVVIYATDKNDKVDPRLECFAREIRKEDDKLTGFRVATSTRKEIAIGEKDTFPILGELEAEIEVKQCCDDARRICLRVKAPKCGQVTYTCVCSKYFPLLTELYTEKKERVVLGVMVKACKEEK